MSSASPTTPMAGTGRIRSRAKKACKACNARRVRCNVMEEQPCKNCQTADVPCELMKSRRGKYERHPNRTNATNRATTTSATRSQLIEPIALEHKTEICEDDGSSFKKPRTESMSRSHDNGRHELVESPVFPMTSQSNVSSKGTPMNEADSTVFLGESSSISLVHTTQDPSAASHKSPTDRTRLRYPVPDAVGSWSSATPFENRRKAARIEYLKQNGAFSFPINEVCEVLFEAYFSWFHPCFPILDRHRFYDSYVSKSVSPLLFQAVLFVGASHCNQKVMRDLGFPDRQEARDTLYNHAKDIYDADYETDKITVSQALFIMSFWRAGPLLEKDTRHWLGAAISLAQTKGMHRSSSNTDFPDSRLRKRIWWSLYVRDRQCSAALGLPTRIRDEDCDIEMLEPSDFEDEGDSIHPNFLRTQKREHVLYAIQMAKLATYLGKIVLREFTPMKRQKNDLERTKLKDDLAVWESKLSPEMRATSTGESFWASMLHLSYNNLYILLYRSAYLVAEEGTEQDVGNIALQAACRNTRIIEDVLSQNLVHHSNVHINTSLFNSLCIHTICLRRSKDTVRKLAEYRAQLCLLGLRELQKTWDVTNWVLQLFFQFLDQSTAKKLQILGDNEETVPQEQLNENSKSTVLDTAESLLDLGQSHISSQGHVLAQNDDDSREAMAQGLDFASHLFGTKEAEDFSMFQLQPDPFSGDIFGGGLDQYYNSMLPRGDGLGDAEQFPG